MAWKMEDLSWRFTDEREYMAHYRKMPPVMVTNAITGNVQVKEANENLPEQPEEQADSLYASYKAGASLGHIHARNPKNWAVGSYLAEDFYKVNKLVRARCPDIIINNTAASGYGPDMKENGPSGPFKYLYYLQSKPEIASLDIGMFINKRVIKGRPDVPGREKDIIRENVTPLSISLNEAHAKAMKENGIKPEIEVMNPSCWWSVDNLVSQGLVDPPYWIQIVFNQWGSSSTPTPQQFLMMVGGMPEKSMFSSIGIGPTMNSLIAMGIIFGGHVRVGMEDNVYMRRGEKAKSNAQLVEWAVRMINELGREVATPAQAREMLGISPIPSKYP
jgi:3-keto-5-aminohexanoate cleavage enzyme